MADRPASLVVVAGTGTGIGKTWVAAEWARQARAGGRRVSARKPVQSFTPGTGPTDAEVLASATDERAVDVCPPHRSYEVAMAPFMAAAALGRPPFTLDDLVREVRWPAGIDLGLVEPAGGLRSPMTADGADTVALIEALAPDRVILVADAGLGTINAVRLCLDALRDAPMVLLNRYDPSDPLHRANRDWLEQHARAPIAVEVAALG